MSRRSSRARPALRTTACWQEERSRIAPDDLVETKRLVVEDFGPTEIAHVMPSSAFDAPSLLSTDQTTGTAMSRCPSEQQDIDRRLSDASCAVSGWAS